MFCAQFHRVLNMPLNLNIGVYQVWYWHHNIISEIMKKFSFALITFGGFNFIYQQCRKPNTNWAVISFCISCLLSFNFATILTRQLFICKSTILELMDLLETSPYVKYQHPICQRQIMLHDYVFKFLFGFIIVADSIVLFTFMFRNCDENKDIYSCGFLIPLNYFQEHQLRYTFRVFIDLILYFEILYLTFPVVSCVVYINLYVYFMKFSTEHLIKKVYTIRRMQDGRHRRLLFNDCIRHHQFIIDTVHKIGSLYTHGLIMQLCSTSAIMCAIIVPIIKMDIHQDISTIFISIGHITFYIIATIIFGVAGEQLQTINMDIKDACFDSIPWDGDVQIAKDLGFMIKRCHLILVLPVGKFTVYSNELCMKIFKMCYSLVTVFVKR